MLIINPNLLILINPYFSSYGGPRHVARFVGISRAATHLLLIYYYLISLKTLSFLIDYF
jgi:hypothetical protein